MSEELRVARRAGVVGAATFLSRVLGLIREQVMAGLFGAGLATDAFNVAFRIPNLLRDLFAEGAMSSAFVPTFTAVHQRQGEREAWDFGRQLMIVLLLVLSAVCVAGYFAAPWLVRVFAPGFAAVPGKLVLTACSHGSCFRFCRRSRSPPRRWGCSTLVDRSPCPRWRRPCSTWA